MESNYFRMPFLQTRLVEKELKLGRRLLLRFGGSFRRASADVPEPELYDRDYSGSRSVPTRRSLV
jgi:hypothetical protein